ncbi:hypothetical protein HDV02_006696 [Globomyces sp. JEL0801]|nr:hypothetical protein HDV02_006696 [Globomyces sp. JEL0801]
MTVELECKDGVCILPSATVKPHLKEGWKSPLQWKIFDIKTLFQLQYLDGSPYKTEKLPSAHIFVFWSEKDNTSDLWIQALDLQDRMGEHGELISINIDGHQTVSELKAIIPDIPNLTHCLDVTGQMKEFWESSEYTDTPCFIGVGPNDYIFWIVWGTWCPPCRKALPKLVEYQNRFGDSLQIIAANIDHLSSKYSVDQTRVQETLTELDCLSLTTIIDQESVFLKLFKDSKMAGIPTMMIIHHGVIVAVDYANPIEEALETLMKTQYRVVTKVEKIITTKKPVDGNIVVSTKSVKTVTTSPVSLIR